MCGSPTHPSSSRWFESRHCPSSSPSHHFTRPLSTQSISLRLWVRALLYHPRLLPCSLAEAPRISVWSHLFTSWSLWRLKPRVLSLTTPLLGVCLQPLGARPQSDPLSQSSVSPSSTLSSLSLVHLSHVGTISSIFVPRLALPSLLPNSFSKFGTAGEAGDTNLGRMVTRVTFYFGCESISAFTLWISVLVAPQPNYFSPPTLPILEFVFSFSLQ